MTATRHARIQSTLLAWGEIHRRDLPWRHTRDPWLILVSEVMLQQTQVDRVIPKYEAFITRFGTTAACAAAAPAEVITLWAGLGYNRRAVMLHRAAQQVEQDHRGTFPSRLADIVALPGVGPYTARAIIAFAFEADAAPVDTNIGRIFARIENTTFSARAAQEFADELLPGGRSWDWNQTLMDFGAIRCTKRNPSCDGCPVGTWCAWAGSGPDPSQGSAGASTPQSKFAGSDRQGRGRLIRALTSNRVAHSDVAAAMGWPDEPERAAAVLAGLVSDGLVDVAAGFVSLATASSAAENPTQNPTV